MTPIAISVPDGTGQQAGFHVSAGRGGITIAAGPLADTNSGFGITGDQNGASILAYPIDVTGGFTGGETIHVFQSGGELVCTGKASGRLFILGGGGAGCVGGGGAGGLYAQDDVAFTTGTYAVAVGLGGVGTYAYGAQGGNGGASSFGPVSVAGGGGGGSLASFYGDQPDFQIGLLAVGLGGGCGGGGSSYLFLDLHGAQRYGGATGGAATAGGAGGAGGWAGFYYATPEHGNLPAGGGGGVGGPGWMSSDGIVAGNGGPGVTIDITPSPLDVGGGGGGGAYSPHDPGSSATHGGGAGQGSGGPVAGIPGTGGGGGGTTTADFNDTPGASGGSGLVVCRYKNRRGFAATGGTMYAVDEYGTVKPL